MSVKWLTQEELLEAVGLTGEELAWFQVQFYEQMRLLSQPGEAGRSLFSPDAVLLLRGLSSMRAQGATPEQIKGWFGLAAGRIPG